MNYHAVSKRTNTCCAICESSNRPSICSACVNVRLNQFKSNLKSLQAERDQSHAKLIEALVKKGKADDQENSLLLQKEKIAKMREKLHLLQIQVSQGKAKIEKMSCDIEVKNELLDKAWGLLETNRVEHLEKNYPNLICTKSLAHMAITSERLHKQSVIVKQICKLFPLRRVSIDGEQKDRFSGQFDTICNARLPRGLDPHSVPCEELAASLGYMVQLLNVVLQNVCGPALHNSGFAGSCSRIWQRDSFWETRPSLRCEYPLFIPRQKFCSTGGETSWTDRNSSNFGIASIESDKKHALESSRSGSFNYASASPHSIHTHKDLQKGIALLKKSVACITAYCYYSLCLEVPAEASTFDAFSRMLAILSSSKEVQSLVSLKTISARSSKEAQQFCKPVWKVDSAISSSTLAESSVSLPMMRNGIEQNVPSSTASFLAELSDTGKIDNAIEEWIRVEPSQIEGVEHWTRGTWLKVYRKITSSRK